MGPSGDMGDAGDNIMIQVGASARSGRKSLFPEPLSAQGENYECEYVANFNAQLLSRYRSMPFFNSLDN